jgi:predicted dehydrogenase
MFIRARYGHGARPGYDKEWRAYKKIAGGGEMLDQGSHIVDLSRYFMGEFTEVTGSCNKFFWDMEVEDNCFAILKTKTGNVAQLHASCTQWKNIFSFEIFCRTGQINIDGLGRSYGKETLTFYKMKPGMGIPDKFVFDWKDKDVSWEREFVNFLESIEKDKEPNGNIYDALECINIIYKLYEANNL